MKEVKDVTVPFASIFIFEMLGIISTILSVMRLVDPIIPIVSYTTAGLIMLFLCAEITSGPRKNQ